MKKMKTSVVSIIIAVLIANVFAPIVYANNIDAQLGNSQMNSQEAQNTNETENKITNEVNNETNNNENQAIDKTTNESSVQAPDTDNNNNNNNLLNDSNFNEYAFKNAMINKYGDVAVIVDNNKILGRGASYIPIYVSGYKVPSIAIRRYDDYEISGLSQANTPEICLFYNNTNLLESSTANVSMDNENVLSFNNTTDSVVIQVKFKYTYQSEGQTINRYVNFKTIEISFFNFDSTQYDISSTSNVDNGVAIIENNGETEIILEKGKTSNKFFYKGVTTFDTLFDDVIASVEKSMCAYTIYSYYGGIQFHGVREGETKITFKGSSVKNGKYTIKLKVVDSLYQYDKLKDAENNDKDKDNNKDENNNQNNNNENNNNENKTDIIPDNHQTIKYDERENVNSDYEALNEELIQNSDALEVTVEGEHVVKSNVFETLKNYPDKKLIINSTAEGVGKITWEFSSDTITNTNIDFKPSFKFSDKKLDSIQNNEITDGLFLDLDHNGDLPGKAKVSVWIGDELAQKYADKIGDSIYLYYYNPETKDYEYMGTAKVIEYGIVEFELGHCSIYLLSKSKVEDKTVRPLDDEPKTGVESYIAIAGVVAILSIAGIVVIKKYLK